MSGPLGASANLSEKYAEAAAYSARQAWSIQEQARTAPSELLAELEQHYRLYCTAAIYNSVLFLEAAIHEFFAAVAIESPRLAREFTDDERTRLEAYWDEHVRPSPPGQSPPVIDRYNVALQIAGASGLAPEEDLERGVRCLIALCDALGQPELVPDEIPTQSHIDELETQLVEAGFALNPFRPEASFPDRYLSHGCAEWGVKTATGFYAEFCDRLGIRNELDNPVVSLGTRDKRTAD